MLSSLPPPALPVNLHMCTCAHTHTHAHTQAFSGKVTPSMEAGEHPPHPTSSGSFTRKSNCTGATALPPVGGARWLRAWRAAMGGAEGGSLALNRQVPGPKPQVLQGEFLSSFSTRFIICLLRPALWENRPSRRQHQALRVKAGMGAQWQWRSGASCNVGSALEALTGSVDG